MAKFVSLFSGAGGLDLGLEAAGWHCLYASDLDPLAVQTIALNRGRRVAGTTAFRDSLVEHRDIRQLSGDAVLVGVGSRRGEVTLLAGGPPCQSWSSAGSQQGFADPRGQLLRDYVRVATELDARWLLFENVRGLVTARGHDGVPGSALASVRRALLDAGWQTRAELLNAADYGVPQRRVRLVLIGYRTGDPPPLPATTHTDGQGKKPWVTLGECLAKVGTLRPDEVIRANATLAAQLQGLKPGSGVKSPGKVESTRPGGHWGYKQGAFVADPARPARTVTASSQQDWVQDPELGLRRLCPRECAAIQSFPRNWAFAGASGDQYRLVGNAVPPALAYRLGRTLLEHVSAVVHGPEAQRHTELSALPHKLAAAIEYTRREHVANGQSRRAAPSKRRSVAHGLSV